MSAHPPLRRSSPWCALVLRRRGQYSMERLCAIKSYCEHTSLARALAVCALVVVPSLGASIVFDAIPLQPASRGWRDNSALWMRIGASTLLLTVGVALQLNAVAPRARLNWVQIAFVSLFATSGYCAVVLLLAARWVFPTPFSYVFGVPLWTACFVAAVVGIVGRENLRENHELRRQMARFARKLAVELGFLVVYPLYNALFLQLAEVNQFAFVFVLPVIKLALKHTVATAVADLEELVPVVMISVDVFNALYQSKCMQSAGSLWTTLGIIAIDAAQNVYSLRSILSQVAQIESLAVHSTLASDGILSCAVKLADDPDLLTPDAVLALQVRSVVLTNATNASSIRPANGPREQDVLLKKMSLVQGALRLAQSVRSASSMVLNMSSPPRRLLHANTVVPAPPLERRAHSDRDDKSLLLAQSVELLWRCELLLLVEFFECAIPFVYAVYLAVLYHLPNAAYYPGMRELLEHPDKLRAALASILVFAALEFASLLHVHAILQRRFRLSSFHQLAFVFETEWLVVQGTLVAWLIIIFQFTLEHHGMDFTFQFAWIVSGS